MGLTAPPAAGPEPEYLVVDEFLATANDARVLKTAFELRLVDRLLETQPATPEALAADLGLDAPGLGMLLDLLAASGIVDGTGEKVRLSDRFTLALRYRDLLEARLDYAGYLSVDFLDRFTTLITDPKRFQREAQLYQLFDYARCFDRTRENVRRAKAWVRLTTALTRYEAAPCFAAYDFGRHRRMLDVGGNSGEFALRACKAHPGLTATVMDLPVVCAIGQEQVLPEPERDRVSFLPANALEDPLPEGFDLITFKSMLHDWPEHEATRLLAKAADALAPGGTLLVYERGPIRPREKKPTFATIPTLLFFRSYREPSFYVERFGWADLEDVTVTPVALDTPFFVATGRKPGAGGA
jgi:SAM-dependent methyltransferase